MKYKKDAKADIPFASSSGPNSCFVIVTHNKNHLLSHEADNSLPWVLA